MPDAVTLLVNNTQFGGWLEVRIDRSMETIAGSFALTVTERWPGQNGQIQQRAITPGDACKVLIGSTAVITGYVDSVDVSLDAQSHTISISGRDVTGDLVDCSAITPVSQFKQLPLETIARTLIAPFGIGLVVQARNSTLGQPFKTFTLEQGETVFEALTRLAKQRAVLWLSDGQGRLVLASALPTGPATTNLIEGQHIKQVQATWNASELFSSITVKSQGNKDTSTTAKESLDRAAMASDGSVRRTRPLVVTAESNLTLAQCKQRAAWELSTRKAKADQVRVTVAGWRTQAGALWALNTLVHLKSPSVKRDRVYLISGVAFSLGADGSQTKLTLVPPEAYASE